MGNSDIATGHVQGHPLARRSWYFKLDPQICPYPKEKLTKKQRDGRTSRSKSAGVPSEGGLCCNHKYCLSIIAVRRVYGATISWYSVVPGTRHVFSLAHEIAAPSVPRPCMKLKYVDWIITDSFSALLGSGGTKSSLSWCIVIDRTWPGTPIGVWNP